MPRAKLMGKPQAWSKLRQEARIDWSLVLMPVEEVRAGRKGLQTLVKNMRPFFPPFQQSDRHELTTLCNSFLSWCWYWPGGQGGHGTNKQTNKAKLKSQQRKFFYLVSFVNTHLCAYMHTHMHTHRRTTHTLKIFQSSSTISLCWTYWCI